MPNQDLLSYGGDLMLFIIPTTGSTKQPIGFSTNAKLTISNKGRDVSSKDSGNWTAREYNRFDWNMSSDSLFAINPTGSSLSGSTYGADQLYQIYVSKQKINVAFASKTGTSPSWTIDSTKKSFTGTAIITNFDVSAQDASNSTFTINLDGDGALTLA